MADLSPAAQAVLDAYIQGLATKRRDAIAAALYAAAHYLDHDRRQLAAIAAELDNNATH
jgi:hypothetical protein